MIERLHPSLAHLLDLSKKRGWLSYEELNTALPDEMVDPLEMDLLLVNLKLAGVIDNDLTRLSDYCRSAADAIGLEVPHNYPVFGTDAFETGTGVHASAVIKAFRKNDTWLADRVYSGVPAGLFGLEQSIKVGPMSGRSNVTWVLEKHGLEPTEERIQSVLALAKETPRLLSDEEVVAAAG